MTISPDISWFGGLSSCGGNRP